MYICDICGLSFDKATQLGGHKSSHIRSTTDYGKLTYFKCKYCEKEMYLNASERKRKKTFCSYACHNAHRTKVALESKAVISGVTLDISLAELTKAKEEATTCAICGKSFELNKLKKCADHCHKTDKFRGILCQPCNRMLGWYENNTDSIQQYLSAFTEKVMGSSPI